LPSPPGRKLGRVPLRMPLAVAAVALTTTSVASAATFTFTVNTVSPVAAPGVTLTGDDQSKTFTMQYTVAYTGTSTTAGWKVQASATAPTSGTNTLPALKVTGVTSACSVSCTVNPTNNVTWPVTMTTTAQKIFNAALNTGQGTFSLTATWQVTYPAKAVAGTYASTVTLTGSTGP
jgi:uncharacterized protein YhdP